MTAPTLFQLGSGPTTTRAIARLVKRGGVAALPDAVRRADAATYQEISCRSALNRVKGMPFNWTLNPYRGCTHGCHYCFARKYQRQLELGAGDEFSSVILVKRNLVAALARDLDRPSWRSRTSSCTVHMSVPSVDEETWAKLEPGTAHPLQRLRAVRVLRDAGIDAGVLMAPILPGISSRRGALERTIKAIADHGARFMGVSLLHLEGDTRAHFLRVLEREYPRLVAGYERLYAGKYAPSSFVAQVTAHVRALQARYGLDVRRRARSVAPAGDGGPDAASQQVFVWKDATAALSAP